MATRSDRVEAGYDTHDSAREQANFDDYRVCELAVEIIEAQRREIAEMDWLIADIAEHGPADTATRSALSTSSAQANDRVADWVPSFDCLRSNA